MIFNVCEFGAKIDTQELQTQYFQKAIDECAKFGGKVFVPKGKYLLGSVVVKSNVHVEFEDGTILWYEPITDTIDGFVLRKYDFVEEIDEIIRIWQ
jgi:polygalacturonase